MNLLAEQSGSLSKGHLLYSSDSKQIYCCLDKNVLILDSQTCKPITSLVSRWKATTGVDNEEQAIYVGHKRDIKCICLHPTIKDTVFTASEEGVICMWHIPSQTMLHSWNINQPIISLHSSFQESEGDRAEDGQIVVVCRKEVIVEKKKKVLQKFKTILYSLNTNMVQQEKPYKKLIQLDGISACCFTGNILCWSNGRIVSVGRLKGGSIADKHEFRLAHVPQMLHLLEGRSADDAELLLRFTDGRGSLYSLPISLPATTTTATINNNATIKVNSGEMQKMHWHHQQIAALSCTRRHCLSGGQEGVLVLWDTHRDRKQFLPHLNAAVLDVVIGGGEHCCALLEGDEIISISLASMRPVSKYRQVPLLHDQCVWMSNARGGKREILYNSPVPGTLHALDPVSGVWGNDLALCPQNLIHGPANDNKTASTHKQTKKITPTSIKAAATSSDGKWIASYQERSTGSPLTSQPTLSFHKQTSDSSSSSSSSLQLYTKFESPHAAPITQICFSPSKDRSNNYRCATVGEDGKVMIWSSAGRKVVKMLSNGKSVEKVTWVLLGSISYRGLSCQSSCWSLDGSCLFVGFGSVVCVYALEGGADDDGDDDPNLNLNIVNALLLNNLLPTTIITLPQSQAIQQLFTINRKNKDADNDEKEEFLIMHDGQQLAAFNLAKMQFNWTLYVPIRSAAANSSWNNGTFTAIISGQFLITFNVDSAIPATCFRHRRELRKIVCCPDSIISVDVNGEIAIFGNEEDFKEGEIWNVFDSCTLTNAGNRIDGQMMMRGGDLLVSKIESLSANSTTYSNPYERPSTIHRPNKIQVGHNDEYAKRLLSDVPGHLLPTPKEYLHEYLLPVLLSKVK